jgi:DnaK suppressor protein
MTHQQQLTAAKRKLLLSRALISQLRSDQDVDAVARSIEKRQTARAQNATIVEMLALLSECVRVKLPDVEAALKRLKLGTWGHCEACGVVIGSARMTAMPTARTCMNCGS